MNEYRKNIKIYNIATENNLNINYKSDILIEKKYSCNESINKCNEDSTGKYMHPLLQVLVI